MATKHGKKFKAALAKVDLDKEYSSREAIALAKETSITKFDSTIEVHMRTALDPRQADQQVRDVVVLPHGLGKTVRVLVFAQGEGAAAARASGADLVAQGQMSFVVDAPRLARHPYLETFAIDSPSMRIIDGSGNEWQASAQDGWVRADAKELRLSRDVTADRMPTASSKPIALRTQQLTALLDSNRMTTELPVTITQPGSILRGVGLDADLKRNQFTLLSDVTVHYENARQ